jgi:Ca2+-binding RTX toxin-like protein
MAILNVGAGQTFTTIQDAIAAASAGDTISVAAGTYTGDITVDKQLFFEGAQLGIAGTDAARAPVLTGGGALTGAGAGEAVITGRFIVNAGVDDVRVDGFAFFNNVNNFNPARIDVKGDNFTFQNNQFLDVTPGSVGNILVGGTPDLNNPPQGGGATFDDNLFQKATGTGNPTLQLHGPDVTFTNNTVINGPLFLTPLPNASNKPNAPEMSDQTLIVTGNTFTNSFRSGLGFVMGDFANLGTSDITVQQAIADGNLLISGNTFNGAAVNVISGSDFDDDMSALATEFADEFRGEDGDDTLVGLAGNDTLNGEDGDDSLRGDIGDDTLIGGIGTDWASYANASGNVTVDLSAAQPRSFGADGNDSLSSIENVLGGNGNDSILGDGLANLLDGGNGNDTLDGGEGDDSLYGGAGNDWASYANAGGAVTVDLSAGTSSGADGNDDLTEIENVLGGIGNDSILGDGLNNRLDGGNGDDRLDGGAGNDALNGGAGNDTVIGGQGFDSLDGGTDIDLVDFSAVTGDIFKNGTSNNFDFDGVSARVVGFERFLLGSGNDFVFFGTATQSATLDGGVGNDVIVSGSGDDSLFGGTGNDFLNGGEGNDTLDGGIGDDVLSDDGGNDSIFGGVGNDELTHFDFGGAAADATLDGGEGDDTLDGGAGNDWASYANAGGAVTVDLSEGTSSGADGSDDLKGIENVLGGIGNDSILGDGLNNVLDGGNGDDTVLSFVGDDSVVGGDGSDSLIGNEGADTLLGGTGNDTLLGNEQADSLAGGDNNDLLQGGQDTDTLDGGAGDDTLAGGTGENRLTGGDGNDFASYAAAGAGVLVDLGAAQANAQGTDIDDQLFGIEGVIGSNHNDELRGDALDNTLYGGGGSDTLSGGGGNDWLDFGAGSDSYTFLTSAASGERQTLIGDGDNIFGNGIGNDILDLGVGWVAGETADGFINYQHVAGGVTTNLWTQGWEQVVCFAEGTRIVTPNGEAAVENLRAGDMVLAMRDGQAGFEPLRWVGFLDVAVPRNATMAAKTAPILIKAGALAPGMPARDLRVSPDHAMEVDGHLIPASHLVNGESIVQEVWCKRVRYFHLELEAHGLLLSEGTWSESYLDDGNRHAFNNAALTGLFLDFEAGRSKGEYDHVACLPVLRRGLKLDEIHGRIALRAQELARATKRQGRR